MIKIERLIRHCRAAACAAFMLLVPCLGAANQSSTDPHTTDGYAGNYRIAHGHDIAINRFITDGRESVLLIADYQSGVVRRLFPVSATEFVMGAGFFVSLGLAVLIYDKRGTGASTGTRLDASTGARAPLPGSYYPDELANDALTVFRFLQRRPEIKPQEIGFWGSSEGGMLATQVAARNKEVAFAINSSGFMGPLWETIFYQAGAIPKSQGHSATQAEEGREFAKLWMRVARTGEDYDLFVSKRQEIRQANKSWLLSYYSNEYSSAAQMRWDWDHILSFDSRPALQDVTCPVLGVFGELDPLTDASRTASNMREALSAAGHGDFTIKIFPNAGHSLGELPSKSRMAPGVFETLRSWLLNRVHVASPVIEND